MVNLSGTHFRGTLYKIKAFRIDKLNQMIEDNNHLTDLPDPVVMLSPSN